ncbi:MAG: dienelactone hydrolase family protein [Bryobacteraceae bacterium]|nr:dienelactone hydrolase family protein [Bryobacteraceae bacterium]
MAIDPVKSLLHLYEDGALTRRDLVQRLTKYTGSAAAALAAMEAVGLAQVNTAACPAGVQVPESDPSIVSQMLTISGEGPLYVYQSLPADWASKPRPAVLVIHENRGLTDHIKDITRRVAKAGYVGLAVDLLSRQGGTDRFPDPEGATAAYGRTRPEERRQDMLAALLTIRDQVYVLGERLGTVGFCAGGANVWDLALNTDQLKAAVAYYGPPPAVADVPRLASPMLCLYAALDRGITGNLGTVIKAMSDAQKNFEIHIYGNANHAFNNDTGARYDPVAACDAWAKTLAFFNRYLNAA